MADITFTYVPRSAEVAKPTGNMKAGVPVTFAWKTPSTGIREEGQNGRLQMVAPPGNNAGFTGVFSGITKTGSGQTSFQWPFGSGHGHVEMKPNTLYEGSITAGIDCAGCTLKLTAR